MKIKYLYDRDDNQKMRKSRAINARLILSLPAVLIILVSTNIFGVTLSLVELASGFSRPIQVTFAPGDNDRIYVVEQKGVIRIIKNGVLLTQPFLDIVTNVNCCGEEGLLSIAFHPNYQNNGYCFLSYNDKTGQTVISRVTVSSNPDIANGGSEQIILTHFQQENNHNGGMLAFSPLDGYLYFGFGDGGGAGDPENDAQNGLNFLGKMIRIDVDSSFPYAVPSDNPFVSAIDTLPEIWAFGLRNPWRFSFDMKTGDMYIADVGQNLLEEINYQNNNSAGGENYGWRLKEGTSCYNPSTGCESLSYLTDPIYEYGHGGSPFKCSISGGYVYRGCEIPELDGVYFFGDFCAGSIWSFKYVDNNVTEFTDHSSEFGLIAGDVVSFGQDNNGEIYVPAYGSGKVYKLISTDAQPECYCCNLKGDSDNSSEINISDLTFHVNYMFKEGNFPDCLEEIDMDGNCEIDITDLTFRINWVFKGGAFPAPCQGCLK